MKPIHELIPEAMRLIGAVGKTERNTQQGFNFRGIDAVTSAVSPAFRELGIFVAPELISIERSSAPTKSGGTVNIVHLVVAFQFTGPAGDSIRVSVAAESFDAGDKATAKAMSVALRTALLQTLLLPTDDPDPDHDTYERAQPEQTLTPLQWLVVQGGEVLAGWDKSQRNTALKQAKEALAVEKIATRADAEAVLAHMEAAYLEATKPFEENE